MNLWKLPVIACCPLQPITQVFSSGVGFLVLPFLLLAQFISCQNNLSWWFQLSFTCDCIFKLGLPKRTQISTKDATLRLCLTLWAAGKVPGLKLWNTFSLKKGYGLSGMFMPSSWATPWNLHFHGPPSITCFKTQQPSEGLHVNNWCALTFVNQFGKFNKTAEMFLTPSRAHQSLVVVLPWYLPSRVYWWH